MIFSRSISYETYARDCALSSEDTHILGVPTSSSSSLSPSSGSANGSSSGLVTDGLKSLILQSRRHSIYSEKGNCESVSVQCTQQDMILTVNFDSPFTGRIYAKGTFFGDLKLGVHPEIANIFGLLEILFLSPSSG